MFHLIGAILPQGKADRLMPVLKDMGIFGATLLPATGLCSKEAEEILKHKVDPSRELLLIIAPDYDRERVVSTLKERGNLMAPGEGVLFVVDLREVLG